MFNEAFEDIPMQTGVDTDDYSISVKPATYITTYSGVFQAWQFNPETKRFELIPIGENYRNLNQFMNDYGD